MSRLNLIFLLLFVGLVTWITLFQPNIVSSIQRGAMIAARPFIKASGELDKTVRQSASDSQENSAQLGEQLREVVLERDRLRLEAMQLDDLLRENNQLRHALQYIQKSPLSLVATRVLSRKPSQWYNTIMIDKGSDAGIAVDCPVIVPLGDDAALVGKISEVLGPKSAVLLLLSDEMCQVSAKIQNSQEQGILCGRRGALFSQMNLRLRYLSKEANVAVDAKVESSGAGELFPPDLLLGKISVVSRGVIDSEAVVTPAVNFDELSDLFVILPTPDEADPPDHQAQPKPAPPHQ